MRPRAVFRRRCRCSRRSCRRRCCRRFSLTCPGRPRSSGRSDRRTPVRAHRSWDRRRGRCRGSCRRASRSTRGCRHGCPPGVRAGCSSSRAPNRGRPSRSTGESGRDRTPSPSWHFRRLRCRERRRSAIHLRPRRRTSRRRRSGTNRPVTTVTHSSCRPCAGPTTCPCSPYRSASP